MIKNTGIVCRSIVLRKNRRKSVLNRHGNLASMIIRSYGRHCRIDEACSTCLISWTIQPRALRNSTTENRRPSAWPITRALGECFCGQPSGDWQRIAVNCSCRGNKTKPAKMEEHLAKQSQAQIRWKIHQQTGEKVRRLADL